jgi:crotonobetainyl-CoA:carnitine CoA-transferase CaiB-like acyl-CoA transferase
MAWLINEGTNYLTSGNAPIRRGNAHPNIVPYDAFAASDGHILVAVGNDSQFARFCDVIGRSDLGAEDKYKTNSGRIGHRETLIPQLRETLAKLTKAEILEKLQSVKVPVGPIHTVDEALNSDQATARGTIVDIAADGIDGGNVQLLANPLKLSRTPVQYRSAPPRCGQDTDSILETLKTPK